MSKTETTKTQPSFQICSVSKTGDKSTWQEIGAAWPHKDGKGLNLTFTARPWKVRKSPSGFRPPKQGALNERLSLLGSKSRED